MRDVKGGACVARVAGVALNFEFGWHAVFSGKFVFWGGAATVPDE
jgi:hypothetical protein